jgi:hypothetical protein
MLSAWAGAGPDRAAVKVMAATASPKRSVMTAFSPIFFALM